MMKKDIEACNKNSQYYDEYFSKLIKEDKTTCLSINLFKDNMVIYDFACGNSAPGNAENKPVTADTQFNIGSVAKTITGALIIKLLELGELTLYDSVKKYINEYKFDEITIYNLLTHTAGYDEAHVLQWPSKEEQIEEYFKKLYGIDSLKHKPGQVSVYWTHGYSILMDIIQRVAGETIEDFACKQIFEPVGMHNTTFDIDKADKEKIILPWGHIERKPAYHLGRLAATGDSSLYTTASDMTKFGCMILNSGNFNGNKVFAHPSIDLMLRDITNGQFLKTPNFWLKSNVERYQCFSDLNSPLTVGHTGFSGCMFFIDPYYKTVGTVLTNSMKLHSDCKNYKQICNVLMSMR